MNLVDNPTRPKPTDRSTRAAALLEWFSKLLAPIRHIKWCSCTFASGYPPTPNFIHRKLADVLLRAMYRSGTYSIKVLPYLDRGGASGRLHLHLLTIGLPSGVLQAEWERAGAEIRVSRLHDEHARYIADKEEQPVVDEDGAPTGRVMGDSGEGFSGFVTGLGLIKERIISVLEAGPLTYLGIALAMQIDEVEDGTYQLLRPDPRVLSKQVRRLAGSGRIRPEVDRRMVRYRLP